MESIRFKAAALLAAGAGLAISTVSVAQEGVRVVPFTADVVVGEDGRATTGDISGVSEALRKIIAAHIATQSLEPAQREGKPIQAATQVRGNVVLTPAANEDYDVSVKDLAVSPRITGMVFPRYPVEMARRKQTGALLIEVTVGADGRVREVARMDADGIVLAKDVSAAARRWTFQPLQQAGVSTGMVLQYPVVFQFEGEPTRHTEFECAWDDALPRTREQSACGEQIEIMGSRVLRRTVSSP